MNSNPSKNKENEDQSKIEYKLSEIIISFKDLIKRIPHLDVYTGEEGIPFSKKKAEFRKILLSEFLT